MMYIPDLSDIYDYLEPIYNVPTKLFFNIFYNCKIKSLHIAYFDC